MKNFEKKEKRTLINLLLIFVLFAIGIIIAGVLYYKNNEKQFRTEVENQLTAIADLKVSQIVQWRKERISDGNIFYKNESFTVHVIRYLKSPNDLEAKNYIQVWMEKIKTGFGYDAVFLSDTSHTKRIIVSEKTERPKSFISPNIYDSLKSGKIVFEDIYRDESLQKIFMKVLVPILDEKNKNQLIAVVEFRIDPETYLYPLLNIWPTPSKTSETFIARCEGNDAVYLNKLKFKEITVLNFRIPLEKKEVIVVKAVMGETGIVEGVDYRGVEGIADVRSVPNSHWLMVARMDKSEIFAPLKEKLWWMIVFIIVLILGSGVGLGFIWRHQGVKTYKEKAERAKELIIANKELVYQNEEKEKRANELITANEELAFQNAEKEKRAAELIIANKELAFQNAEKEKRAAELIIANKELVYQNEEKEKRANELITANKELAFQNDEKEKRAAELAVASRELVYQNQEKNKRAAELVIADKELAFQTDEKEKRADELVIANIELDYQNVEKEKRAAELVIADKEVVFQHEEKEKQVAENKELEAFSYSVSHDLRAPLRHIGGFIDLLIKNSSSQLDETGLRYLNIISESSKEMGNLIDALLTFSRLSRTELQKTKINSKNLVNKVLDSFSDELSGRDVEINITELPDIKGDEKLITQVWVNLISNALKYTRNKEKALIEIGGKTENGETIFHIKDNGTGFDMKYADKLFGVFQRLHKVRDFEGIGIGLANVNRIIVRHKGKCRAESEVGKGATFFFSIPNN